MTKNEKEFKEFLKGALKIQASPLLPPPGFEFMAKNCTVWFKKSTFKVVITGDPNQIKGHDCDVMGCCQDHVLFILDARGV